MTTRPPSTVVQLTYSPSSSDAQHRLPQLDLADVRHRADRQPADPLVFTFGGVEAFTVQYANFHIENDSYQGGPGGGLVGAISIFGAEVDFAYRARAQLKSEGACAEDQQMAQNTLLDLRLSDWEAALCQSLGLTSSAVLVHLGYLSLSYVIPLLTNQPLCQPDQGSQDIAGLILSIILFQIALFIAVRAPGSVVRKWITGLPFAGVVGIGILNFLSHDASAAALAFLFLPAIFAASQLSPARSAVLTVMAIAAAALSVANGSDPQPPACTILNAARGLWATSITLIASWLVLPCCAPFQKQLIAWLAKSAPWRDAIRNKGGALLLVEVHQIPKRSREKLEATLSSYFRANDWIGWIDDRTCGIMLKHCSPEEADRCAERVLYGLCKELFEPNVSYTVRFAGMESGATWNDLHARARAHSPVKLLSHYSSDMSVADESVTCSVSFRSRFRRRRTGPGSSTAGLGRP